jgi:ABC-2 type transport system ATP-binding protein
MLGPAIFQTVGLSKTYGRRQVLDRISFQLVSGEALGLIGPNGAGKTTLLRTLLGLIRPTTGEIHWEPSARVSVGHFGGGHTIAPQVAADRWSALVSRGSFTGERRRVRELSRGNRQMLGLQSVLAVPDSRCIFLDEPWEGLDPDGARWLTQTIQFRRRQKCAFILSSHRLHDLAGSCDRYAFLLDGRLRIQQASDIRDLGSVTGDDLLAAFDRLRTAP